MAFGRKSVERAARDSATSDLPSVTQDHLEVQGRTGEPSQRLGPGGPYLDEAAPYWNARDYDRAEPLLMKALDLEPTMPYESFAHSLLGQICLERNDVFSAVDHLLKSLEIPGRHPEAQWMSAVRLQVIYDEAGKTKEAAALQRVAQVVNARGLALTQEEVETIRSLVRGQVS